MLRELQDQPIITAVWNDKYRYKLPDGTSDENSPLDTHHRVIRGVYQNDPKREEEAPKALAAMTRWDWCPAGRIHAGAGTPKRVTWINCFVAPLIEDSMEGIMHALEVATYTQQQGGGIGMDFSTLRPNGAIVRRTGSISSGVIPFMRMWNSMCSTIMSSGSRRGAMMGTLADHHPDLPAFITAKQRKGELTNFNVSVLVSDKLMKAVERDETWDLGFQVPPANPAEILDTYEHEGALQPWYVYRRVRARELWDMIIRSTYEYAEPGVIFIDRINETNNLNYCEQIRCSNPCGEQPLPPNGDCNLGAVNLATMVNEPFTKQAHIDWSRLKEIVRIGIRFLDNVLDQTSFPTEAQKEEAQNKRRTGLGITGLGNMLQQLRIRYGSDEAIRMTQDVMRTIRDETYLGSIELAKERGPFPLFSKQFFSDAPFIRELPEQIQEGIRKHGIRNGVCMTIAPTGTTSIYYGNVSSGLEPTFAWRYFRKMLMPDDSLREFPVEDFGYRLFCNQFGTPRTDAQGNPVGLPSYMVTALELTVDEHLRMQAACQSMVDASISKTINCPESMSFEDFRAVYSRAYELGLKGCTTYRPSGLRGAILSTTSDDGLPRSVMIQRPEKLHGTTYKIKWPLLDQAFYITINDLELADGSRQPFEIFINSKSVKHQEWIMALTRTVSAVFRKFEDPTFLVEELEQVYSPTEGQFIRGHGYVPSLVAMIGKILNQHFTSIGLMKKEIKEQKEEGGISIAIGDICPQCNKPTFYHQESCGKCVSCGYSTCN